MTNRTARLQGMAYCLNDNAEVTIKINEQTVFSGPVETRVKVENPDLTLVDDFDLYGYQASLCSFEVDKNLSGNLNVEITCNKGIIYFATFLWNYCARVHKIVSIESDDVADSFNNYLDVTYDPAYENSPIVETFNGLFNLKRNQPIGNVYRYLVNTPVDDLSLNYGLENTFNWGCDMVWTADKKSLAADEWTNVKIDNSVLVRTTINGDLFRFSDLLKGIGYFSFVVNQGQTLTANYELMSKYLIDPDGDLQAQVDSVPYCVGDRTINFTQIYQWVEKLPVDLI